MIIFLYGEDTFRSRQKLQELKNKFVSDVDSSGGSVIVLNGATVDMSEINNACASASLFSKKQMVIIENIFANKSKSIFAQIVDYLKGAGKDSENIIIFREEASGKSLTRNKLFSHLKTEKFVQEFSPLSNTNATNWVKKEVVKKGANITHNAAFHLTSLFSSDLWQLSSEIDKLINYKKALTKKGDAISIEITDIEEMSRGVVDENIFALIDAISERNRGKALELFERELEAGLAEHYLVHMIMRQFKILLQVRLAVDMEHSSRKIINELKIHPFVAQKSIKQVRNFSLDSLKSIFKKLVEIDYKLKTGQGSVKAMISLLIARNA